MVSVNTFGSPVKSAAEGMYCAPISVLEEAKVPDPVEVHSIPEATVNDPAMVAEVASAQMLWSAPATAVGAGVTVTIMLSEKAGQKVVGSDVAVKVKVVAEISAGVGVYVVVSAVGLANAPPVAEDQVMPAELVSVAVTVTTALLAQTERSGPAVMITVGAKVSI